MRNLNEMRRQASSKDRILAALQAAGAAGCTNAELNAIAYRFGGRLEELRKDHYDIESINEGEGRWRYVMYQPSRRVSAAVVVGRMLVDLPVLAYIDSRGMVQTLGTDDAAPPVGKLF